jgi:hypothetical protein
MSKAKEPKGGGEPAQVWFFQLPDRQAKGEVMRALFVFGVSVGIALLGVLGGCGDDNQSSKPDNEITKPEEKEALMGLIVAAGYECPEVKLAWAEGESPLGPEFTAYCGPPDDDKVFTRLEYKVYPKDGIVKVDN